MAKKIFFLLFLLSIPSARLFSYITSAVLEYTADDVVGFYLNGKEVLSPKNCEMVFFRYACLSSSDGTLPLSLFNSNAENLLAIENDDLHSGDMFVSFRLTLNRSDGDPVVVWSEPEKTRMFHRGSGDKNPEGWDLPTFDDKAWPNAKEVTVQHAWAPAGALPDLLTFLEDAHFKGSRGRPGHVPVLSDKSSGIAEPKATSLFRIRFFVPNALSKPKLTLDPAQAVVGQALRVRISPGPDLADLAKFRIFIRLPQGMEPLDPGTGGSYDPKSRFLIWNYQDALAKLAFLKLDAESVLSADGWRQPERALGPWKETLRFLPAMGPDVTDDGGRFFPERPGWFKLKQAPPPLVVGGSQILGVIFHCQVKPGGMENDGMGFRYPDGTNQIFLNYSVDGSQKEALPQDIKITRANVGVGWMDAYYDATQDRAWTWKDIDQLRVKVLSHNTGGRHMDWLASCGVTVKTFPIRSFSPDFTLKVSETTCKTLKIQAGIQEFRGQGLAMDMFEYPVNQGLCKHP